MDERRFHQSIKLYHQYNRCFRYFDNVEMILVVDVCELNDRPSQPTASKLDKKIQSVCSDEILSLIPENFEEGKMKFLEGTLYFSQGFSSTIFVKNNEYFLRN